MATNYGLCDYGASKVMQSLQLAAALYSQHADAEAVKELMQAKAKLEVCGVHAV